MAVIATDPNMQQDENAQDKAPSSQGVNVSGTQASDSTGGAPSQAPQGGTASATPTGSSSGRFQNIQNYINANKGYNQDQGGLAGQVGSSLAGQENKQEQAIGNESNRYQTDASTAAQPYNYYLNNSQSSDSQDPYLTSTLQDPTKVANDPNALNQWQQYYSGAYTAPTAYDSSGQLNQNVQNYQQQNSQTGSESGRMSLLNQLYGNPGYNTGQQSLDNLLLQSNPGQLSSLQSTASNLTNQLGGAYTNAQNAAQGALTAGQSAASAAKAAAAPALGMAETGFETGINQKVSDINAQRANEYNTQLAQLQSGRITKDQATQLGINTPYLYGVDPTQFLQQGLAANIYQAASPEDYARAQALSTLAGQPTNTFLPGSNVSQSGQIAKSYSYNAPGLQQAIAAGKSTSDQAYQQARQTTPVQLSLYGGAPKTITMGELRDQIARANQDLAAGGTPNADLAFLKYAQPALEQAENQLSSKQQQSLMNNPLFLG